MGAKSICTNRGGNCWEKHQFGAWFAEDCSQQATLKSTVWKNISISFCKKSFSKNKCLESIKLLKWQFLILEQEKKICNFHVVSEWHQRIEKWIIINWSYAACRIRMPLSSVLPTLHTPEKLLVLYPNTGCSEAFWLSKKFTAHGTCVFWCKMTWGTMFTKVILLSMAEAR